MALPVHSAILDTTSKALTFVNLAIALSTFAKTVPSMVASVFFVTSTTMLTREFVNRAIKLSQTVCRVTSLVMRALFVKMDGL